MRDVPPLLSTRATLCWIWILTLRDQTVFGFTDHDRALVFKTVSCKPHAGLTPEASRSRSDMDADAGQIQGVLEALDISDTDIVSGRLSRARLDRYRVNWQDPDEYVHMSTGFLGDIEQKGDAFVATWRGEASLLERSTGRVFSRMCDAEFGDIRCGIDTSNYPSGTQCSRTLKACHEQFNNALNFRGFPYILGDDALTALPSEGEARDGGSRYS